jgi:type VI secretion system secreted protein VgrG
MMYAPVTFVLRRNNVTVRRIHGIITGVRDQLNDSAHHSYIVYTIRVQPQMWNLTQVVNYDIYLNETIPDIIRAKLNAIDLVEGTDYAFNLLEESTTYQPREFVLQYRETDLAFVQRLAEHWGISFYFDHSGGGDKVVFTDHGAGFNQLEYNDALTLKSDGNETEVYDLFVDWDPVPDFYCTVDYNYRRPTTDLTSTSNLDKGGPGGIVDYASHYYTTDEGAHVANVRAQEQEAKRDVYRGRADLQQLAAGHKCTIGPHTDRTLPTFLITKVEYRIEQPGGPMQLGNPNKEIAFDAIDATKTYRPPRVTPKPRIDGVIPAVVQYDDSDFMDNFPALDSDGRYVLKFKFDMASTSDRDGSHRVRMAQTLAGEHYGFHFPVRRGVEVMVAFEDGDPDRPVIVGAIHHPTCPNPVVGPRAAEGSIPAHPGNQSKSRIKTESGIMIELEDGAGSGLNRRTSS